jgi:HEPN domain-containing protein
LSLYNNKKIEKIKQDDKPLICRIIVNVLWLLKDLNPEYLSTRYPDMAVGVPAELYDESIAARHLKTAEQVIEWVKKQIQE